MDLYTFCALLGFAGMVCMAVMGMSHGAHDSGHAGHGGHGHAGNGHAGHAHGGHAHDAGGHAAAHSHATHGSDSTPHHHGTHETQAAMRQPVTSTIFSWLSPRVLFSLLFGFGAVGFLATPLTAEPFTAGAAVVGGLVFEKLIVSPIWGFVMRFASTPARTLESAVAEEARAVTNFDANGQGLIAVDLDGQVVQVLGTSSQGDPGARVLAGDILFVEAVDPARNSCTVSRMRARTLT